MDRKEVHSFINEIIEDNNGVILLDENELVNTSELDSFGYTMFYLALDVEYEYFSLIGLSEKKDPFRHLDYESTTVKNIIDAICK